jgi:RNA polymerase sigma-70 factor (ECF subfamily)
MREIRENLENSCAFLLQNLLARDSQQQWYELLEKIAQGDLSALGSLYQDLSPILFGLILCIVVHRPLAEEILLEVFKQVWSQAAVYDAKLKEPLAWLIGMARTRALACRRSGVPVSANVFNSSTSSEFSLKATPKDADNTSVLSLEHKLARAALLALSATEREVIELAYFCGLSPNEIALKLEMPQNLIENHLTFAMMQLRQFLNPSPQEQL